MIASLSGTVLKVGLDSVVVGVGGVGMLVHTTPATATSVRLGQPTELATSLVVREDSLTLYGFATDDEKHVFETVQTVSGVGPRLALAVLAVHSPDAVRVALGTGDLVALTKVPGIGKKGAERMVLELKDKLGALPGSAGHVRGPSTSTRGEAWREQVREALVGLGWTARQADDALDKVAPLAAEGAGVRRCCAPPCRSSADERRPLGRRGSSTPGADAEVWDDGSFDATARIVDAVGDTDERQVEAALRPKRLDDFPGQTRVRDQLGLVLKAAKRRGTPPDHVLLSGPPGLGKTTLAMIVAGELEQPIRITSGPAIQHAGDLASVLSSLAEGEVLFLDEIHRMSRSAEEMLYLAMEDFRVDVIIGKGPGRHGDPARAAAVHRRRRHDARRAAARAVARPVRLHRRTWTTTPPPTS